MLPAHPSIFIPRIFVPVTEAVVRQAFERLQFGQVRAVQILEHTSAKGDLYQRVYVHFHHWYGLPRAKQVRDQLLEGQELKIVYDPEKPWFWKMCASKWSVPQHAYPHHKATDAFVSAAKDPSAPAQKRYVAPKYPRRQHTADEPRASDAAGSWRKK